VIADQLKLAELEEKILKTVVVQRLNRKNVV